MVRSWNAGPDSPLDDDEWVDVAADGDLLSLGSIAMSSKDVERISSRNTLARWMTDLENRRMCSPKRERRLVLDEAAVKGDDDEVVDS